MENKSIIGKTLTGLKIANDDQALLFELQDEDSIVLKVDGDFLSRTWIESVTLPESFPATVIALESGDTKDHYNNDDERIQYYMLNIVTDKGIISIDYRNESNGYYGGNLSWPWDSYYDGGVFGQNISNEQWIDIVQDLPTIHS